MDSLRSAHLAPESPFKWFLKDGKGFFRGLKEELTPLLVNEPKQTFESVFIPNGYIDILKTENILNKQRLYISPLLAKRI